MKQLVLFSLFLILSPTSEAQSEAQIKFVNDFIAAVESHDRKAVIKMMDKGYRKEQIAFLEGNKVQFVDELFGGADQLTNAFINIKFDDIQKIEVAEVQDRSGGDFEYVFRIRDGQHDILRSLLLVTGKKFGFVGAMG